MFLFRNREIASKIPTMGPRRIGIIVDSHSGRRIAS